MRADLLIAQACEFLDDGDGMYRMHEPSRFLAALPGVTVVDVHHSHHLLPWLLRHAHVLILPFVHNWDLLSTVESRRNAGQVTVFEANDNFYDVQPWSPIASGWRDPSIQAEYKIYMRQCDAVQTSTSHLAELWQSHARRVAVFPNQLSEVPTLEGPPDRPLTIGWGGSPGHFADWYAVAPLLQEWLRDHPDVHLAVMCNEMARPFIDLPPERYHFTPFGSLVDYLKFLAKLDIGLAPLLPTEYNRGRSDVKFLEYAAHGVVGIYADLEPYRASVVDGQTGFLFSNPKEMLAKLDELARDHDMRRRIRQHAYDFVSRHRRLADHISKRLDLYRSLLHDTTEPMELPEEIISAATVDGRYLQLRPGESEQVLIAAQKAPAKEAIGLLSMMTKEYPDYALAALAQGRLFNDARMFDPALSCLQHAAEIQSSSAAILCEMGRTQYLRGETGAARQSFEKALNFSPWFYPGYQYFLRFLKVAKLDAGDWPKIAREKFPNDLILGIAVVALMPADQQVSAMRALLDAQTNPPHPEVGSVVTTAVQGFAGIMNTVGASTESTGMLAIACRLFPRSARLAWMHAAALHGIGKTAESAEEYRRALEIRDKARCYATEFPREDGSHFMWQVVEFAERFTSKAPDAYDASREQHHE